MNTGSDWRLAVQHDWLRGVPLTRRAYRAFPTNPSWDHDHCAFCWEKFESGSDERAPRLGYCTLDEYHWICDACFLEFRGRFGWTLQKEGDAI
jgi:hypothetical protein